MKWQKVSFNLRHDTDPMDLMQRILNSLPTFSEVHSFSVEQIPQGEGEQFQQQQHRPINWFVEGLVLLAGFAMGWGVAALTLLIVSK